VPLLLHRQRTSPARLLVGLAALSAGCGAVEYTDSAVEPLPDRAEDSGESVSKSGTTTADSNALGRARCRAPSGVTTSPQNTAQALELLNALPKPTSVACFVESLARPLSLSATSSRYSSQPALTPMSPRVFIKLGQLSITIAIDGEGSKLLEFGDMLGGDERRTIKGELELPLHAAVSANAPYDRVRDTVGTVCGFCHRDERAVDQAGTVFSSISFRPQADTYVSIASLRLAAESCDWGVEPRRCELLSALFDGGTVVETPFSDATETFF
jgi:hypothetical protein